ncbi:efflux RND transporter periplasmic adaptor subunit [candidate division KSB1 bacterium]|nr:efflux RND transporter periplasmic adaptor subunit [candidate division KSB1 bacterium]
MDSHFKYRHGFMFVIMLMIIIIFSSCGKKESAAKVAPAHIENPAKENELTTITLTEKAKERLGIQTTMVASKITTDVLKVGGEIIAVPGHEARLSAPVAGIILHARNGSVQAGASVKKGQEVMRLLVLPSGSDMLSAQEEVVLRQVEYDVALTQAQRAEQLLSEKAISEKALQEAQASLTAARTAVDAAKARANLLNSADLESIEANLTTLILESPIDGTLLRVLVAHGQTVASAAPLFEVVDQNPVWIRVVAYIGDLPKIDRKKDAYVLSLGGTSTLRKDVKPVQGPPLSNPGNASADLYYKLYNETGDFRIGQKVMVSLPLMSSQEHMVVPYSAILYDMHGDAWLYVQTNPVTFMRRRVQVSHVVDDIAVIARGVQVGNDVVTTGAMELFGTEFGGGK